MEQKSLIESGVLQFTLSYGQLSGVLLKFIYLHMSLQVMVSRILNPALSGNFPVPEGSTTPAAFSAQQTRNEGTIPGVGVALQLSIPLLDTLAQGDQNHHPILMPFRGPYSSTWSSSFSYCCWSAATSTTLPSTPTTDAPFAHATKYATTTASFPYTLAPTPQIPPYGMPSTMLSSIPGSLPMPSSIPLLAFLIINFVHCFLCQSV